MLYYVISSIFRDVLRGTIDVCRLSENELSDSNGLFCHNEGEMYTSEEQGDSTEDEEYDSSLLAALEMGPYLFEHNTNWHVHES